jgi:hypothetical protein
MTPSMARAQQKYKARLKKERTELAHSILGRTCVKCGSTERSEFHHKDPSTKCFEIWRGNTRSLKAFLLEVEKCEVLCTSCHSKVTRKQQHFRIIFDMAEEDYLDEEDLAVLMPMGGKRLWAT